MPLKGRLRRTRSSTQTVNVTPGKADGSSGASKARKPVGLNLRSRAFIGNKVSPRVTRQANASASTGRRTRGRATASKSDKKDDAETSEDFDDEEDEQVEEDDEMEEDDAEVTEDDKASPSKNDDSTTKNARALRRRDKIKTTERYSPELHEPTRRTRGRGGSQSFPSTTASSSKYISFDSDEDGNSNGGEVKRRKVDISTVEGGTQPYILDVKKDEESNKIMIMLPDGTIHRVDPTPGIPGYGTKRTPGKAGRPRPSDEEFDEDYEDDGAIVDDNDEDFKPRQTTRRKKPTPKVIKTEPSSNYGSGGRYATRKPVLATGIKVTAPGKVRPPGESTPAPTKLIITPKVLNSSDGSKTTKITSPSTTGKTKVTFITTPKSVTLTATSTSFKQPPKRNYGSSAKFIDELPELSECTTEDNDSSLSKLPDRILFINSDLPLQHGLPLENENKLYLFHQVMSPIMTTYPCLLCPGTKFAYKEEKDLIVHYSSYHELTIEHITAKFSDDTVFVCLPKSIITQLEESENGSTIILNAPCQYCGEQIKLETIDDMKNHYADVHSKEIKLIEQEEIMSMHKSLYCCLCEVQSPDFTSHHNHMKTEHHMHTYVCKCCVFTTQDSSRLKTHFRAKHMISNNRIQNLQCTYCSGLIYGIERMNKHIMITHCVQTDANEFSCTACLQPCGKADELLAHSYRCPSLTMGTTPKEIEETDVKIEPKDGQKVPTKCFLCDKVFKSAELCDLHLNHVHTKWAVRNVIHDTFLMVKHPNGKTDLMPSTSGAEAPPLKLNDLPPMTVFDEVGTKKNYGHYCFKCESIIKIYPLYYLHMFNVHKMGKVFECKISSCRKTFKEAKGLEEHTKTTKHPQKSVIEDPLGAIACHFCNLYFADDKELQKHLLSEDHFNKINQLMDKSGNKPEPRNHKCKTCHTWFGLADSYIYHLETESHKHGCSYCGLHFALPSSRRTHIQSHHSEKSDICEICNVKQGSKERLFAHLVEHNIVFECNRCMRKFYQREQLNAHMETHGDSRDCPWEGCQRKINRSSLTTHIRQHRIENESKCNICGKGFSSRQVLQTHMEIHAKAESNAKAILQAVPSLNQHKSSSSNQSLTGSVSRTTTPGTTLISITTPPSSMTSIKQRSSPIKSRGRGQQSKTVFTSSRSSNGIPSGLRIMCCSCNQAFNSHNELSNHKCVVPVVTITGTKPNSNEIQLDQNAVNNLISSPIVISQSNKFQLPVNSTLITTTTTSNTTASTKDETTSDNLEEDPQKLVLDIAEQLSQAVQEEEAEKLKQKQLEKVEQLLQQQSHTRHKQTEVKKPIVGSVPTGGNMQSRTKRTYSSIKTTSQGNDVAGRQIATTNSGSENQIEEIKKSPIKEVAKEQPQDTIVYSNDQSGVKAEVTKADGEEQNMIEMPIFDGENANPGDQYIMLQQSDGQCYQICVPEGMDMEDVVRSLNITFSENPDGATTSTSITTTDGATATPTTTTTVATTADPLEQSMQEVTDQLAGTIATVVEGTDEQQVIYLPVNEDGTCAIDPAALAMLTGSGELPIIVTSSN